jgi:hypothetical protein
MYKGTHRLVKIYQGMSKKTKVAVATGVIAVGLAAGTLPSLAASSSPVYADSSVTVSAAPFSDIQNTLSVVATGTHSSAPVSIPSVVGSPSTQISPIVNGDTLTFTATTKPFGASSDTFVITSSNVPAGVSWSTDVTGNKDVLTAQGVTGTTVFPLTNVTVTAKVTDSLGDVTFDTVTFSPAVAGINTAYNVWQVQDAIPALPVSFTTPLYVNDNATGAVDFTVPAGDQLANLGNAPVGVAITGNSIAGIDAVPGKYSNVTADITDAGGAVSVEDFALTVKGAVAVYNGPKLSQGHAVKVNSVRENVYFVQSGAASYDEFTIVGPGKINGHKGWVNAHVGLNEAVYGGLEANHGYTVYYTPVTGPGSTTPVDGSHYGYVYFVS